MPKEPSKQKINLDNIRFIEERAHADALFSSIGVGVITTDNRGRIDRINDVALRILGYKRNEVVGKWFPKTIVAVDEDDNVIEPIERPITRAFLSGKPVSEELYYKTKTGNKIPVSSTVSPILLKKMPIGAVEVFTDISQEYEIDRMKSEFISIASHQLRTPLSAINTYANMLASGFQGDLNENQQEYMNIILSSIARMNELITTLLDVSRMEAGKISATPQPLEVSEVLAKIMRELQQQAEEKNLQVTYEIPEQSVIVHSDPLLLNEVYSNLISNAIKYTPQSGEVKIRLEPTESSILFSVKDTGYGIPQQLHGHVFSKFFRADNVKQHDTTGTGLGLYMVKQIAGILNGDVWFESAEDQGSTFYFSLPKSRPNR